MKVFTWGNQRFEKDTVTDPMDSIRYHRMFLQTGVLAVDPTNSEIKAWVGGVNFKYFQFDHIYSQRQVGSTFKPFVYATAIAQQHISPCFEVFDQPVTIEKGYMNFRHMNDWTPKNATGRIHRRTAHPEGSPEELCEFSECLPDETTRRYRASPRIMQQHGY
jgi:penicillin-binding protein 1A